GQRLGMWTDRRTGARLDLTTRDPLLVLGGRDDPANLPYSSANPPVLVRVGPGPWLERQLLEGRRKLLTSFGSFSALLEITDGRVQGAWARAIGLGLQQIWRERLNWQRKKPFSRRELLELYPPKPSLHQVLRGSEPKRVRLYWDGAIDLLFRKAIIGARP